jgi:hypothetical protein
MENFRGICTNCGLAHSDVNHSCSADKARLIEIDREVIRTLREEMIALGRKGFNNKLETLENEAVGIRARLQN